MKNQDVYAEPRIFKHPGCTVIVYQPILTDEERARRMKEIEKAAAVLILEHYKIKKQEEKKNEHRHANHPNDLPCLR